MKNQLTAVASAVSEVTPNGEKTTGVKRPAGSGGGGVTGAPGPKKKKPD